MGLGPSDGAPKPDGPDPTGTRGPQGYPVGSGNLSKGRGEMFPLELGPRSTSLPPPRAVRGSLKPLGLLCPGTLPPLPPKAHDLFLGTSLWSSELGEGPEGVVDVPPGSLSREASVCRCGLDHPCQARALVPALPLARPGRRTCGALSPARVGSLEFSG